VLSVEVGQPFGVDGAKAELAILDAWIGDARAQLTPQLRPPAWPAAAPGARIKRALEEWAVACPRPLVLFFDEVDALADEALVSFLRQLRQGYPHRGAGFPWSVVLFGLRDIRDYRVDNEIGRLGTASPFNVKVESLTLTDFTRDDVAELLRQHTSETGQPFTNSAIEAVWHLAGGQPWLVNALARQCVEVVVPDRGTPVDRPDVLRAKAILIERQDTHLDSLVERLREERVRSVIEPMLAGEVPREPLPADDVRYVTDLGLVRASPNGGLEIANPIYAEIIPTSLSFVTRSLSPPWPATWVDAGGEIDPDRLLDAFLAFWRQHGEPLLGTVAYHEIAPHVVLMAFLHRVVNGGGSIEREYAIGRGRMDLIVRHRSRAFGIEIKVWRDGRPDPTAEGIDQLDRYLEGAGLTLGWLVVFDRRADRPPTSERVSTERLPERSERAIILVRA
jgi:hypothetical protein